MSSLWFNLRVIYWHLQIGPDWPWVAVRFNQYRWNNRNYFPFIELH